MVLRKGEELKRGAIQSGIQAAHYHGAEASPYKTGLWPAAGRGTKAERLRLLGAVHNYRQYPPHDKTGPVWPGLKQEDDGRVYV